MGCFFLAVYIKVCNFVLYSLRPATILNLNIAHLIMQFLKSNLNLLLKTALILAAVIIGDRISAANYYFHNLGVRDGLSQSTVYAILQDRRGFMWFGTKGGLCRYDGNSIREFKREKQNPFCLGNNYITCLYEDNEGRIWVGTDAGVYIYTPETEKFVDFDALGPDFPVIRHTVRSIGGSEDGNVWIAVEREGLYCYDSESGQVRTHHDRRFTANVQSFITDGTGRIWIGFYGNGLYYSDDDMKTVCPYVDSKGTEVFRGDVIHKIIAGSHNQLFISSQNGGVQSLNLTTGERRSLLRTDESGEDIVGRDLLVRSNGELWIGAETGIYIYNLGSGRYRHIRNEGRDDFYALSDNAVYAIYEDREGDMWIGTYFGGVDCLTASSSDFRKYYPTDAPGSLRGRHVREMCRDNEGNLWIATEDAGLNKFSLSRHDFSFFAPSASFTNIQSLGMVDGRLWVGTFSKGLKIVDPSGGQIVKSFSAGSDGSGLMDNSIFAIRQISTGKIFVGTMFGLQEYENGRFKSVPELNGKFIYDIFEDSGGNLWLATYANGVYRYDINTHKWTNFLHDDKDPGSLPGNKVLSIFEDSRHRVMVTTEGGGFCIYSPRTQSFTSYNSFSGLPSDVVYQIVEDSKGLLWLTTGSGLVRFDLESGEGKLFTTSDGLLSNQFNYCSSFRDDNGDIYFGSIEGLVAFNPAAITTLTKDVKLAIFDFLLYNKEVHPYDADSPLEKSITYSDNITLGADQNSFSLRVGTIGARKSELDRIVYRLDGFDSHWIELGESPIVTYSNLEHGKYRFRMKAIDGKGNESEECTLQIRIRPPFYLSIWAYILYTLVLITSAVLAVIYLRNRNERTQALRMEKLEREKERELYRAKIDFFTNVAHEIRTPLTLIHEPLEHILRSKKLDDETVEDLGIMHRNSERLLNLVNQLLDFRKVERSGYRLNFSRCNVSEIVEETYTRFGPLARQKNLDYTLELPEEPVMADISREAFTKVLSNLFNNGVKYAGTYLHIRLCAGSDTISVITDNDGNVVVPSERESIFKAFVRFGDEESLQGVPGSGIGLALARSLAELHGGTLVMDPVSETNMFVLTVPVTHADAVHIDAEEEKPAGAGELPLRDVTDDKERPSRRHTVLVVDDNTEMRSYLRKLLQDKYSILEAADGREALKILEDNFVNLVVSDVMMTGMDGFELCRTIKSDMRFSHIPVVLLTAKTNIQSKIEGMEMGADSYIEKPFSAPYLLAVISNLISSRETLRRNLANSHYAEVSTMALTKADEEFICKLSELIQTNLQNPDFNIDDMAGSLNMSRSSFYRKVEGVLDLSPKEYLKVERLKRAAELLKSKEYRINEICYMVGFSTSSYFTKCFLKQYGVLPKDYVGTSAAAH